MHPVVWFWRSDIQMKEDQHWQQESNPIPAVPEKKIMNDCLCPIPWGTSLHAEIRKTKTQLDRKILPGVLMNEVCNKCISMCEKSNFQPSSEREILSLASCQPCLLRYYSTRCEPCCTWALMMIPIYYHLVPAHISLSVTVPQSISLRLPLGPS